MPITYRKCILCQVLSLLLSFIITPTRVSSLAGHMTLAYRFSLYPHLSSIASSIAMLIEASF
jgi:hypothetical protein